ncbi:MAG: hypothetical protein FWC73_10065 [Defluviitaleaceae bacterium]|nr:hypothetical protein [Defluviitaleaceae bacterium]
MNINFHYFTVKTLARAAGFDEPEAQQIAQYSQFVDDYNPPAFMTCTNIPEHIRISDTLDLYVRSGMDNFRPVATGFTNPFEYAGLLLGRDQRLILSPFHFTPFDENYAGIPEHRVVPLVHGDNSLMDRFLHREISDLPTYENLNIPLMRIGMLLHTFADTYAHQMFTGYVSWANRVNIIEARSNAMLTDCTAQVREGIGLINRALGNLPPIGHVQAGHNPDLSDIAFAFSYVENAGDNKTLVHSQDNTEVFLQAGEQIYTYLQECSANPIPWEELAPKLRKCFLIEMPRRNIVSALAKYWEEIFPENNYEYSSSAIRRGFRKLPTSVGSFVRNALSAYTDEFYEYNVMANEVLAALYGARPRGG